MKNRSPLKMYFAVVSILSVVGVAISTGILLYNIGSKVLITDDEYLIGGSRSREISQCDQPERKGDKSVERTPESKATCKAESTKRALDGRTYDHKTGIILGFVRLVISLIIYMFHYSKLRSLREDETTA